MTGFADLVVRLLPLIGRGMAERGRGVIVC
jgi:hypothetical protein